MNTRKTERAAVRTIEAYIDSCQLLEPILPTNDKTPIWDGEIYIYNKESQKVEDFIARVPSQVKGTTNTEDDFRRIDRKYIEAYHGDGGCVFFLVQVEDKTYKPLKALYVMLSLNNINALLRQKTQTIKINLKELPANSHDFEKELVRFSNERRSEPIEYPAPKEIANLLNYFNDIEQHLNEIEDKTARIELGFFLKSIYSLKNDGTVGWRDDFVYLASKVIELTLQHVKRYDALYLQFELADYLSSQKLYFGAENFYLLALEACRERAKVSLNYNVLLAATLNNLGNLHLNINKYSPALKEYEEAFDIYRDLAKDCPKDYLPNVAKTLNNLGNLHSCINQFTTAEDEYLKALDIRRELAEDNPDAYLPNVATTLNNLGMLHDHIKQHETAEKEYKEALDIRRELAKDNPDAYLPNVATTLNNLGMLHDHIKQHETAEKEYKEALDIRRELAKDNPDAFIEYVADTLYNIAVLMKNNQHKEEARQACIESLDLYKAMAQKAPQLFNKDMNNAQELLDHINEL